MRQVLNTYRWNVTWWGHTAFRFTRSRYYVAVHFAWLSITYYRVP